jgi:hypothetical protein
METVSSCETSVNVYQTTQSNIPENSHLNMKTAPHVTPKIRNESREKLGEKCPLILPAKYLCHTPQTS